MGSLLLLVSLSACLLAQQPAENQPPPRSDGSVSSSKETKIDLSAPPGEQPLGLEVEGDPDVVEMRPYDPHRAEKAVEVGSYYLKRKNYPAAESRFQEALEFKPHHPEATVLLGSLYERTGRPVEAFKLYAEYVAGAPGGERAQDAAAALDKLRATVAAAGENPARLQADALAQVAEQYFQARNWPLERERYEEALRVDPRHPRALLRMAQTLEQLGEFRAAVRAYDSFLAVAPSGKDAEIARAARDRLVKVGAGL